MAIFGLIASWMWVRLIWECMLYGGEDWSATIYFNRYGEGLIELIGYTILFLFFILMIVYFISYMIKEYKIRKDNREFIKKLRK